MFDMLIIFQGFSNQKGLLAIAKLKPLSLFISLLLMLKKALDNVKIEKWKVKVVSALQYLASPFHRQLKEKNNLSDYDADLTSPWLGVEVMNDLRLDKNCGTKKQELSQCWCDGSSGGGMQGEACLVGNGS